MGLDTVELVMEVEDAFGIEIPDDEATRCATVGDLYACVLRRVSGRQSNVCLSAHIFYRLRRAFAELRPTTAPRIHPSTPLESLAAPLERRRAWRYVERQSGLRLPGLERSVGVSRVLALAAVTAFGASLVALSWAWTSACAGLLLAGVTGTIGWMLTQPLAIHLPHGCNTVGNLAQFALSTNCTELARAHRLPSADVWHVLSGIICEQLGVERARVTPDARFVDDFGVS